ncbi:MAG: type I polyketide synthase, partial [Gammaproteobacteria bacterium]|nr:type I polyketide synthase [Gammaproteobacteria bacterium]
MTTSVTRAEHINRGSAQSVSYEPIAIVGMGCRFPGGSNNPYEFWENLVNAKNCITPTPEDRWNVDNFFSGVKNKKAKMNTRWGGYIDGFDEFDPVFFGISPREADYMDPQQRKLLEVTWEAMEDGGLQPSMLSGRAVGVFIGGFTLDYKIMQFTNPDFSNIDAHTATGIMMTMLSNRISYIYNLNGPSLSIDTACSSSLVAVDLACRSLQQGDSEVALAGGVLLNMAPQYTISETQGGFLSPTGSSHAFSSSADGYVRSEGVGVVVLKKLSAAIADGDQIHAVIRGTAVNQDGKTNGITVPDADAQFRLMKKTYALAGVDPGKVQYIEAHGTGTPVGDPVEAESVGRLLALNRSEKDRCYIGSAKTNIGHTEAAAGMAGLIKTVMAIKHGKIPPHLHLTEINPKIDIDKHPYDIPTTLVDWPEHEGPMLAGVNSFGFGGTNAHLVLSEYIEEENESTRHISSDNTTTVLLDGQETIKLFPVSSRDKASLQQQARVHVQRIEQLASEKEVDDLAYTSAHIREQHEHRATFIYRNKAELMDKMRDFIANEDMRGASLGRVKKDSDQKLVWVMTGMGPQWWAMGRQLYQREPVFKQAIDEIHEEFLRQVDWSLLDEWIYAEESASNMANTWLAQTANFALQIGLARMWRQYGPEPAAIVGHSTGEIASFYLAGVYSLKDAVAVAVHRSRLQHLTHGMGKMLAVGLTEYDVQTYIARYNGEISIAAINSPDALVLAGDEAVLNTLSAELQQREIFNRFLRVDVPYHSPVMDQIKDDLLQCLSGLQPQSATLPLYSTVTGERVYGPELDADYWWLNVRQPVLFAKTSQEMIDDGYHNFLEVGPHPVLSAAIQEVATALKTTVNVVASLHREQSEQAYFFTALASLHSMGVKLDWPTLYPDGKVVRVPTYQWRKDKYWHETPFYNRIRCGKTDHPLLGNRQVEHINSWRSDISLEKYPYLKDHSIQQQCILPAAAYIEMAYGALTQRWGNADYSLHDLSIEKGLFLKDDTDPQTTLQFDESSSSFTITSKNVMPSLSGADVASAG